MQGIRFALRTLFKDRGFPANVAAGAGDTSTEALAREIQAQESEMADRIWRFIPTRSKLPFNMLAAGEIDPAIETKAPDDRVLG